MTIKELYKMNGLDENGKGVLSDDEKRAKTLSKFGLNPLPCKSPSSLSTCITLKSIPELIYNIPYEIKNFL